MSYAQTTYAQAMSSLRKALRYLVQHGLRPVLVEIVPQVGESEPRKRTVTDGELKAILQQCPLDLRLYVLLCSDLAVRSGTAVRLAPVHRQRQSNQFSMDKMKHHKSIVLPITAEIAAILDLVEANPNCNIHTPYLEAMRVTGTTRRAKTKAIQSSYQHRLTHLLKKLGIVNLRTHDLRRTTAQRVYEATKDVRMVQGLLGHSSLNITTRYLTRETMRPSLELLESVKRRTA